MGVSGTFGSPRDIINITKSMNDHGLSVGASKHNVADLVNHEFYDEFGMSADMHSNDNNERDYVENSKHDDGHGFEIC